MFIKPISIKSNNKIKASEKKHLLETFCSQYSVNLISFQSTFDTRDVFRVRIATSCGATVTVYKFGGEPLLIELDQKLIPTVRFLWSFPDLLPHFITHEQLVPKLTSGADLMIPGVVSDRPLSPTSFGGIEKGVLCAISTTTNRAPVAVGHTAMSAYDMFMSAGRGKAVIVFHVLGDQICSLGSLQSRPSLEPDDRSGEEERVPAEQADLHTCPQDESQPHSMSFDVPTSETANSNNPKPKEDYNMLLRNFLLLGIKSVQDTQLPMPVNVFYANHVLAQKPASCDFDIKKTSHKKVGVFLKAMQEDGLLVLNEPKPGILQVKSLARDHPEVRDAQPMVETSSACCALSEPLNQWPDGYPGPPTLEEVRILNGAAVMAIFKEYGYRPGDCISQGDVHKRLDQYVRTKQLQRSDNPSMIQLNEDLMKSCDPNLYTEAPESTLAKPIFLISFTQLVAAILKKLTVSLRLRFPNDACPPVLWRKRGTPCLHLYSATKNGKHLTRIANLDTFRIDPDAFAKRLQLHLACSAMRVEDPQYPDTVVIQAQGTHLVAISSLLTNIYGIPKRMIQGFTEPPKKKKNK